ncbi:MAG TPA: RNA 2',3'-cyclic phosphodiesterase [Desulfobacteraceae bacterium]|nr:RNA 2',3'-cyclic phosphodiesterase [Desulfobacteraceae bacterium]
MDIRSFLAFELPEFVKEELSGLIRSFNRGISKVRWVKRENMHLTVLFLGNISEETIPAMAQDISDICKRFSPFIVRMEGVGCFPNLRNPKVIWVGIDGEIERMAKFHESLIMNLSKYGIKQENRTYRPHLTLGRVKGNSNIKDRMVGMISKGRDITDKEFILQELVLFKSDLRPRGPLYTKLNSWSLLKYNMED